METILYILTGLAGLGVGTALGMYFGKSKAEKPEGLVPKETCDLLSRELEESRSRLTVKEQEIRGLAASLATKEEALRQTNDRLTTQAGEIEKVRERMMVEFENIAGRLLEKRSEQFVQNSKDGLSFILQPFQERLEDFRKRVMDIRDKDIAEKTELKGAIQELRVLNQKLSEDANNLASALKGDSKIQGDWGEFQMETLLEAAGLTRGIL